MNSSLEFFQENGLRGYGGQALASILLFDLVIALPTSQLFTRGMQESLTNMKLRKLKALAQRLEPALKVGKGGLSEGFIRNADEILAQQELVKIKFVDFKDEKKTLAPLLAQKTSSHMVMRVGNVVVLYREAADPARRRITFE